MYTCPQNARRGSILCFQPAQPPAYVQKPMQNLTFCYNCATVGPQMTQMCIFLYISAQKMTPIHLFSSTFNP